MATTFLLLTDDCTLEDGAPNQGSQLFLELRRNTKNIVFRFDMSLVANTVINSAVFNWGFSSVGVEANFYSVRRLTSAFLESQCTWIDRLTGVPWITPGGLGDTVAPALTGFLPTSVGPWTLDVQPLLQIAANAGLSDFRLHWEIPVGRPEAIHNYVGPSSESGLEPFLEVDYSPIEVTRRAHMWDTHQQRARLLLTQQQRAHMHVPIQRVNLFTTQQQRAYMKVAQQQRAFLYV
jgi:hypothetical protein